MGIVDECAPALTAPSFPAAAQTAAAAIEARWPGATAIVIGSGPAGTVAICRGTKLDLGSTDTAGDPELLDSVIKLLAPAAASRIRRAGGAPRAVTAPLVVDGERLGVLFVFGLPAATRGNTPELLGSLASLLATISHLEMQGERLVRDAEAGVSKPEPIR